MTHTKLLPHFAATISRIDPEQYIQGAKRAQALAILDALDGIVLDFAAIHIVRDQNGVVVVRIEDMADDASIEQSIPKQYRGATVRDALAQAAQVVA